MAKVFYDFKCQSFKSPGVSRITQTDLKKDTAGENADPSPEAPLNLQIVAVSEGIHNRINFDPKEIEAMVTRAIELMKTEKRQYVPSPIVLDHSWAFLDKVGATLKIAYAVTKTADNENRGAALAGIQIWRTIAKGAELAKLIDLDPENTYFSVRVMGDLVERDDGYYLINLELVHIAVVLEPADGNARIISENGKEYMLPDDDAGALAVLSDFALNTGREYALNMAEGKGTDDKIIELSLKIKEIEKANAELKAEITRLTEALKKAEQEKADFRQKAGVIAELKAADPNEDTAFLEGLSMEQLTKYKDNLARIRAAVPPVARPRDYSSEQSRDSSPAQPFNEGADGEVMDLAALESEALKRFGPPGNTH